MRLDVGYLVTGRGRDRLERADLVGDEVLDLGGLHARKRPAAEAVQVAVTGMRADADAAHFRKLHRPAHDVGIAGMKPQAMLTEVASSIMAASLPISHAPNPSPRSQLRSIVVMSMSPCASGSLVNLAPAHLPMEFAMFRHRRR